MAMEMSTTDLHERANANNLRREFEERCANGIKDSEQIANGLSVIIVGAGAFGSSLALELVTHYRDRLYPVAQG